MANPTSNFNWQMPTPTDLVTDLPADFEVFGQAVDSSMADLLGGTSGQILAKNSNTDMDFVWIANDQGDITGITASSPLTGGGTSGAVTVGIQDATTAQKGAVQLENSTSSTSTTTAAVPASVKSAYDLADGAIPKTLIDAAGDLIVGTAADTAGRLGIGTANQVLAVNTGATALEWKTVGAGALTLITTNSFSAQSSVSIDSVFSSTYDNYRLLITFDSASVNQSFNSIRLRASGSDTTSNYKTFRNFGYTGTVASGDLDPVGTDEWFIADNGTSFNGASVVDMTIFSPNRAKYTVATTHSAYNWGNYTNATISEWQTDSTQFTGFSILVSSGTITGNVSIYGYGK